LLDGLADVLRAVPRPAFRVSGASARQLLFAPLDPWPGDPARGRRLMGEGQAMDRERRAPVIADRLLHGFSWLGDVRAVASDEARAYCLAAARDWIGRFGRQPVRTLWTPELIADRLVHWLAHYEFFGKPAEDAFKVAFFRSLARQALELARTAARQVGTGQRLRTTRALLAYGATVPGARGRFARGLTLLESALGSIPADGCIAERNPSAQLAALRDLVDIRALLVAAHCEPPAALPAAIARAAAALSALRHGDGGLALFHGSSEDDAAHVGAVLSLADGNRASPVASTGGFERLAAGTTLLILDAGRPPPPGLDGAGHAGTLAFELSAGAARLIVNCGSYAGTDEAWLGAGRVTAAHSTLIVADRNSSKVLAAGGLARTPELVAIDRQEERGAAWLTACHDGYLKRFGFLHRRRLFLDAGGDDLRGEDCLEPVPGMRVPAKALGAAYALRFHIHPDVTVGEPERDAEGNRVVPFASAESGPWQLAAESDLELSIEDSLYLGQPGTPRKARQIVLGGRIASEAGSLVKWAIRRMV
jgi:uncharacterized heparinase superfamily protein